MVPAGRSAQLDHLKVSTSRKQDNLSLSVNRIWWTAPENIEIMAARVVGWTTPSSTSRLMVESIPRIVTRMRLETATADSVQTTLEPHKRVRAVRRASGFVSDAKLLKSAWDKFSRKPAGNE